MEEVITKRNILAASHKVFDPLGITGPVLLQPKLWLQSLRKSQIGWDQEVDIKTSQDFLKWIKELEYLKYAQVPRWLHCDSGFQHILLHFFCDASKLAYSAVVFLQVDIESTVHIQLVQSKTKIAPCRKKETTIARLELLGAAISARLSTTVLKEFPIDNVYFWTDSTTVLAWLKREEPWGVFVYNRVQEIRKLTPVKAWRHVPGSLNPADCPSRGCSAKQLCSLKWWEGPSWLHLSPQEWPISDVEVDVNEVEVNKERRAMVTSMMNVQTTDIKSDYFSTYSRNNRVVAWILRFIHNVSNATKLKGSLGYEEFEQAEVLVFKSLQSNAVQDERLLAKMQAFKDEDGLLRIRTKLADTYEKEDFKFPILLPANDVVVKLIGEAHVKAMHAGSSILRAWLRKKFWIIRAKRLVKQVLFESVICKRYKAKHVEVPFAPLPRDSYSDKDI
ncbi:integrase_H2C2 domain-containing protein [Trichonephila clavipes]|nr:integrase_H2C2 domain-containing protein [Trichonephila clavipes]